MSKYTIDRFDDGFAVLLKVDEEETQLLVPEAELKGKAKEGDRVKVETSGSGERTFEVLKQETLTQKQKAEALLEKLKNKNK